MGTAPVNRMNDYWKSDRMYNFSFVREQMSRDRVLFILRCINFPSNNQEQGADDRLDKI